MPDSTTGAVFADAFADEDDAILGARDASAQFGIDPVSPAVGAALAVTAAARPAASIVEIGTGVGVSGLWLLRGAPTAQLTTIDVDLDQHQVARGVFATAGHPKQVRFITGDAREVLPRMNDDSYDLVLVDADWESLALYVEAALRIARVGGTVLVARAMQGGKVANPARRDRVTTAYRELLKAVRLRDDVLPALLPVGDGLLQLVRR
ncbi:MAG: O-methyltransferase [Amnibacterium sp.]